MICLIPRHSCIQADDFTAKLFGIYKQVQQEGQTQVKNKQAKKSGLTALKLYLHSVRIFDFPILSVALQAQWFVLEM